MGKDTFDAKLALADIMSDKKPKRGRKKGGKNNITIEYPKTTDSERMALMKEVEKIYVSEGFEWLLQENPREKYTTDQLRFHVERLRQGHRAWRIASIGDNP